MADARYESYPYIFANKGLQSRFAPDRPPETALYRTLKNLESRIEHALSTRYGRRPITVTPAAGEMPGVNCPLPAAVHTLARLKSLNDASGQALTYRYAGASSSLYRRAGDTPGAYQAVLFGLSGERFSAVDYRPEFSSVPYLFIADAARMAKDNGGGADAGSGATPSLWGIHAPPVPAVVSLDETAFKPLTDLDTLAGLTFDHIGGTAVATRVNTTFLDPVTALGKSVIRPASMAGVVVDMLLTVGGGTGNVEVIRVATVTVQEFGAQFTKVHEVGETIVGLGVTGTLAASTVGTISAVQAIDLSLIGTASGNIAVGGEDIIHLGVEFGTVKNVARISLLFDVGDGSFTQDYYRADLSVVAPTTADPPSGTIYASDGTWVPLEVQRSRFVAYGEAGTAGKTWAEVNSFRIEITSNDGAGGTTVGVDDLYLLGGSGPDVTAGVGYDYRYTYFNINTGAESAPSPVMIAANWAYPIRQGIYVVGVLSDDPQVTHLRWYRRGGTLADAWRLVAEVPVADGPAIFDTLPDYFIALKKQLELDNYPPITSTLRLPVDTTLRDAITGVQVSYGTPDGSGGDFIPPAPAVTVEPVDYPHAPSSPGIDMGDDIALSGTYDYYFAAVLVTALGPTLMGEVTGPLRASKGHKFVFAPYDAQLASWVRGLVTHLEYYYAKVAPDAAAPTAGDYRRISGYWPRYSAFGYLLYTGLYGFFQTPYGALFSWDHDSARDVRYEFMYWYGPEESQASPLNNDYDLYWPLAYRLPGAALWTPFAPADRADRAQWRAVCGTWNGQIVAWPDYTNPAVVPGLHVRNLSLGETAEFWRDMQDTWNAYVAPVADTSGLVSPTGMLPRVTTIVGQRTVHVGSTDRISVHQQLTIGTGLNQEVVVVQNVDHVANTITAYFQYTHAIGERVYGEATIGQAAPYAAIAFDQCWIAGDADNPGRLYYSRKGRMESFPPQNYVDVTSPSDPIMGVLEVGGYLWVATLSTWYRVYSGGAMQTFVQTAGGSAAISGGVPQAIKTGLRHGLVQPFAYCVINDDVLFRSVDGIYSLKGDETSKLLQWLFRGEQELGPLPPADLTAEMVFSFEKNEVFIAYTDITATRGRIIFSQRDQRWRNDDVACSAMLYEEDTGALLIGRADGMVLQDRYGDVDWDGYLGGLLNELPMAFTLLTESMDQGKPKNPKVYNEVTIDLDTHGSQVNVAAVFDAGTNELALGTLNTTVPAPPGPPPPVPLSQRGQVPLNINAGVGQSSRNVAFKLSGTVRTRVDLYEAHIRALLDAEERRSWDTYWLKYGSDEYKIAKQAWIEYAAAAAVEVSCYIDGSATALFSFVLPATTTRKAFQKRFPATKFKLLRWIATSASPFQIYAESQIEVKPALVGKGYERQKLQEGV